AMRSVTGAARTGAARIRTRANRRACVFMVLLDYRTTADADGTTVDTKVPFEIGTVGSHGRDAAGPMAPRSPRRARGSARHAAGNDGDAEVRRDDAHRNVHPSAPGASSGVGRPHAQDRSRRRQRVGG